MRSYGMSLYLMWAYRRPLSKASKKLIPKVAVVSASRITAAARAYACMTTAAVPKRYQNTSGSHALHLAS